MLKSRSIVISEYAKNGESVIISLDEIPRKDMNSLDIMVNNPHIFILPDDDAILKYSLYKDFPELFMYMFNKMQLYMRPNIYQDLLGKIIVRNRKLELRKVYFKYQKNIIKLIVERGNIYFTVKAPLIYYLVSQSCSLQLFEFYIKRCSLYDPIEIIKRTSNPLIVQFLLTNNKIEPRYFNWSESREFIKYSHENYMLVSFHNKIEQLLRHGFQFNIYTFLIKCREYHVIKLFSSGVNNGSYSLPSHLYDDIYKSQNYELFKKILKLNFLYTS